MDSISAGIASDVLTTEETSWLTHVKEGTLRYWRATNQGPPWFRLGPRKIAYRRSEVEAWMQKQYNASSVDPEANREQPEPRATPAAKSTQKKSTPEPSKRTIKPPRK
jgi:prophage regulatory protein